MSKLTAFATAFLAALASACGGDAEAPTLEATLVAGGATGSKEGC